MRAMYSLIVVLALFVGGSTKAETDSGDHWAPVRFLLGEWEGLSTGQAGEGRVSRQYEFVLAERFIRETNTSTYPAQEGNPGGEIHEHVGYFSYDKARKLVVLRQFHSEGFVNQYALSPESEPTKVVFASERFENFSNEWRARETYEIIGVDEFIETFELAPPGKPFEVYSKNHFTRAQP